MRSGRDSFCWGGRSAGFGRGRREPFTSSTLVPNFAGVVLPKRVATRQFGSCGRTLPRRYKSSWLTARRRGLRFGSPLDFRRRRNDLCLGGESREDCDCAADVSALGRLFRSARSGG